MVYGLNELVEELTILLNPLIDTLSFDRNILKCRHLPKVP